MRTDSGSSRLAVTVGAVFLVAVYLGLGLLFYSPEQGFGWLWGFLLVTFIVLGGFALLIALAAKKRSSADQKTSD